MNVKTVFLFLIPLLLTVCASAQRGRCTTIGQTPATAFPVCGVNVFTQKTVPQCVNNSVPADICGAYPDTNPYWYQFTCYQTGTFGFLITPNDLNDDYDWELFDITGHTPNDVYSIPALYVSANWSGSYGITGTSVSAQNPIECASVPGDGISTYSTLPTITVGHKYLLLVSHYTQSQSGYQLSFGGGTASITDPTIPAFQSATYVPCDFETISIKLSKKVRCSSVASDGSDFSISSPSLHIISATGYGCNNGFDCDSIILKLDNPLTPGAYTITSKTGNDGNTLLDDCANSLLVGDNESITVTPIAPVPMGVFASAACSPTSVNLVFGKRIECNSIAADGSDFSITGSTPVSITGAHGICDSALSDTIVLQLSAPIYTAGAYQVTLNIGTDGNSVIDECHQQVIPGQTANFTTADTVSALFNYTILYGCIYDTIQFANNGGNGINNWQWHFDSTSSVSSLQNPVVMDSVFGPHNTLLIVSNGVCTDTSAVVVLLDNTLKALFSASPEVCPEDNEVFINNSIGNIVSWNWDFGDGTSSADQNPLPHTFPATPNVQVVYNVSLIIENNIGCFDTTTAKITKVKSCYIDVASGFTPNGDGHNDYLYPLNAYKATNLEFKVFNRYGQLVFETKDWTQKWDGSFHGKPQDSGTYVWMLQYTDTDTGKRVFKKGTTVLIR